MQTVTQYGWVKMRIPRLLKGALEYDLKTPDVNRESALLLEESHPTVEQGCRAHTGIVRGRFFCAGPEKRYSRVTNRDFSQDRLFYFEHPIPLPDRIYRIRVSWAPQGYRIWIDGVLMKVDQHDLVPFEMAGKPYEGIDTITLHPGIHRTRLSLNRQRAGEQPVEQLPPPHVAFWGNFRLFDQSDGE